MALKPYYYMLGQSTTIRGTLAEAWLTANADDELDDTEALIKLYNYDNAAVETYDTVPASMNSNTQVNGELVTAALDVTLFRRLLVKHPTGVHILKYYAQGNVGNNGSLRWGKTFSESYTAWATADTALRADITGGGDTVDVKGFFLAFGYVEAATASGTLDAAFKADLQQLILDLRTDFASASTPVLLDLPPKTWSGITGSEQTSLDNARKVILEVANEGTNIGYMKIADEEFRITGEPTEYTGESTMRMGRHFGDEMDRLVTGKGSVTVAGAPVIVMIGDDNLVGAVDIAFLEEDLDEEFDGPIPDLFTWNWTNNAWEALDGTANSNSEADGLTNFGPDVSMAEALLDNTEEFSEVYIFKLGRNASSFGNPSSTGGSWKESDADIFTTIEAEWGVAVQALYDTEDKIPDVRALIIISGPEDVATQALADAFAVNLASIIDSYRDLFQTRTGSGDLPVVLTKMQDTGFWTQAYVKTVQSAQIAAGENDPAVLTLSMDAARVHSDDEHLSGSGTVDIGQQMAGQVGALV